MKKKLTVNSLALGNLKQRRKQYFTLIIGIILAIIFSSGTLFFISCNQASTEEYKRQMSGNYNGYYYNLPQSFDMESYVKDGYLEKYGYSHIIGYAYTDEENKDKGTAVAWLDENAKDLYYITINEGRYPENKGEIALEVSAALGLGIEAKIGDEISLSVFNANGEDFGTEATQKKYKIVGIFADKKKNLERFGENGSLVAAAFVSDKEEVDIGGKEILSVYFKATQKALKQERTSLYDTTCAFEEYFISELQKISPPNLIRYAPPYRSDDSLRNSSRVTITLAIVLMLASCIGIINAFSTNLQERRKQIGMLRAVGTTRRQIINIFGREAFIISLICAPVGVAVSYFGVKLYATLMGENYIFIPDFKVLLGTAAISVVCVMLAALIPLISASRISPMQAIRNVELNRKMKRRNIKTQKEFNVPHLLAKRSIKFYKSKQIGVSVILVITIFVSCFGLSLLKDEVEFGVLNDYSADYTTSKSSETTASMSEINFPIIDKCLNLNIVQGVHNYPKFSDVYGYKTCDAYMVVDEFSDYMTLSEFEISHRYYSQYEDLTRDQVENKSFEDLCKVFLDGEKDYYLQLKEKTKTQQELFYTTTVGFDQKIIEKYMKQFEIIDGDIDIDKLNSGEEILLVANEEIGLVATFDSDNTWSTFGILNTETAKQKNIHASAKLNYKAGDTIKLRSICSYVEEYPIEEEFSWIPDDLTSYDREVKIGAIVKPMRWYDGMSFRESTIGIMTTAVALDKIAGYRADYSRLFANYDGELDDNADLLATEYLEALLYNEDYDVVSKFEEDNEVMTHLRSLAISLIAVVILFFAISASIVNNALTAKIRESKKEIGTLRAVGASIKEITASYVRQLLSMFGWGCGIGFISYIITHIVVNLVNENLELPFIILPAVIICGLLFIMCSLNLYLKIKKEMKNSIVDNIREL